VRLRNRATTTLKWREIVIILLTFVNVLPLMLNLGLAFVDIFQLTKPVLMTMMIIQLIYSRMPIIISNGNSNNNNNNNNNKLLTINVTFLEAIYTFAYNLDEILGKLRVNLVN
jgi:hypothetical protein